MNGGLKKKTTSSFGSPMKENTFKTPLNLFCGLNDPSRKDFDRKKKYGLFKTLDELRQMCLYGRPRSKRLSRISNVLFAATLGPELQSDSETLTSLKRLASARSSQSRPFTPKPQENDRTSLQLIKFNVSSSICKTKGESVCSMGNFKLSKGRTLSQIVTRGETLNEYSKSLKCQNILPNSNESFPFAENISVKDIAINPELVDSVGKYKNGNDLLVGGIDEPSSMVLNQKLIQLEMDRQIALLNFYCQRLTSKTNKAAPVNRASQKLPHIFKNLEERVFNQIFLFIEEYQHLVPEVARNIQSLERILKKPSLLRKVLQDLPSNNEEKDLCYLEDLLLCIVSGTRYIEKSKTRLMNIHDKVINKALKLTFGDHVRKFQQRAQEISNFNIPQSEVELYKLKRRWLELTC